jgi:hypothetical protein
MMKKQKKDLKYFKGLKKVKDQVLPNTMIPRTVSIIQDLSAKVTYLVDWRDKKYTSIKTLELPKENQWDYDTKNWTKITA